MGSEMGNLSSALADVDAVVQSDAKDVDSSKWHKVWMCRGGLHRKLAQQAGGDSALFAKAVADYQHVLMIDPPVQSYTDKANRCLQQLRGLMEKAKRAAASPSPTKRRRLQFQLD